MNVSTLTVLTHFVNTCVLPRRKGVTRRFVSRLTFTVGPLIDETNPFSLGKKVSRRENAVHARLGHRNSPLVPYT